MFNVFLNTMSSNKTASAQGSAQSAQTFEKGKLRLDADVTLGMSPANNVDLLLQRDDIIGVNLLSTD